MSFEQNEGRIVGNLSNGEQLLGGEEIIAVAKMGGGSRSTKERIRLNTLLRDKLAVSSDNAVAWAATRVAGLVERELLSRIEQGRSLPFEPLFEVIDRMVAADPKGGEVINKGDKRTIQLISQYVLKQAGHVSEDEMVRLIGIYVGRPIWTGATIFDDMLIRRDDIDQISKRAIDAVPLEEPDDKKQYPFWGNYWKNEITSRIEKSKRWVNKRKAESIP